MSDTSPPTAVVCDDDDVARSVITGMAEERGLRVIAEADRSFDAIQLIDRFRPDLIVLDMGLASGSGREVLDHLEQTKTPCHVIVFTAFTGAAKPAEGPRTRVIEKPDFAALDRALADASKRSGEDVSASAERRRDARAVPAPTMRTDIGLDDPLEFYRSLGEASAGDAVLCIPGVGADPADVSRAVRAAIRTPDRMILRQGNLLVLLIGGGHDGPPAVIARIAADHPEGASAARAAVIGEDDVPTDVLEGVSRA